MTEETCVNCGLDRAEHTKWNYEIRKISCKKFKAKNHSYLDNSIPASLPSGKTNVAKDTPSRIFGSPRYGAEGTQTRQTKSFIGRRPPTITNGKAGREEKNKPAETLNEIEQEQDMTDTIQYDEEES